METAIAIEARRVEKEQRLAEAVRRERGRLNRFIRQRVPDPAEAEDILQDVFYEFVETWRLPEPIEQAGAWLLRVARNRIVDRFRKKKEIPLGTMHGEGDEEYWLETILPATEDGPEDACARNVLLEAIQAALEALPPEQRDVFIAHEIEGKSFKQIAADSGVSLNTLLARKRYALRHLQTSLRELRDTYQD